MYLKDHYHTLGLEPSATLQEIKKAYRSLAQQFHPDKNNNDPYSAARFTEIKEAYEVLSNPSRREYYLQQRWYEQSIGRRKKQETITPENILKQSLELDRYVARLDIHRMDKAGLLAYISELISDETIAKLNAFDEPSVKSEIALALLRSGQSLNHTQFRELVNRLQKLNPGDKLETIASGQLKKLKQRERWEKNTPLLLLLVVLLICLLIATFG